MNFDVNKLDEVGKILWYNYKDKPAERLTKESRDVQIFGCYKEFTTGREQEELYVLLCLNNPAPSESSNNESNDDGSEDIDVQDEEPEPKNKADLVKDVTENRSRKLPNPFKGFWRKRDAPLLNPKNANLLIIFLGLVCGVVSVYFQVKNPGSEYPMIAIGIFTSIFTAGIVNFIVAKAKSEPLVAMMHDVAFETWKQHRRIRHGQSIVARFSMEGEKIIVKVTHKFHFKGKPGEKVPFEISSDYRKYKEEDESNPSFRFEKICIDGISRIEHSWEDVETDSVESESAKETLRQKLQHRVNNKLFYEHKELFIGDDGRLSFEFVIRNEYLLRDRMVWAFQGYSKDNVSIGIRKENSCKQRKGDLSIWFNHPMQEGIRSKNESRGLSRNGTLKGDSCDLEIPYNIVAYQGFELFWDFES